MNGMRLTRAKASDRWGLRKLRCANATASTDSDGVCPDCSYGDDQTCRVFLCHQIVMSGIPSQNLREADGIMKHLTDAGVWLCLGQTWICLFIPNKAISYFHFMWNSALNMRFYGNNMNLHTQKKSLAGPSTPDRII